MVDRGYIVGTERGKACEKPSVVCWYFAISCSRWLQQGVYICKYSSVI